MKKLVLASGLVLANLGLAMGQSAYDALAMSRENPILGTARYTGMAGAMSAFGGDASTMKDNPAGLGVYRKSDITLTPNLLLDNDDEASMNINNFGVVINFGDTHSSQGYVTSSFGIAYNRLKNYSRSTYTEGYDYDGNAYENQFTEDDGSGEWNFAYGLNISNIAYLGLGINATDLHYKQSTLYNDEENSIDVDGTGFNIKLGAIIRPVNFLRIGLAFQSPTWYNIKESGVAPYRDSTGVVYDNNGYMVYDNWEDVEYDLTTPLKVDGGLGFVIGKRALLGINYIYEDYTALREKDDHGQFRDVKKVIENEYKATHTIKVGAEVQIVDGFAVRAGYAYVTSPTEDLSFNELAQKTILYSVSMPKESQYITLGAGYHGKVFYADVAYAHCEQKEDFYEWMENITDADGNVSVKDPIKQTLKSNNISLTLGLKF